MNRRSILDDGKGHIVMDDALEFTPELMERARINAELDAADAAAEAVKAAKKKAKAAVRKKRS